MSDLGPLILKLRGIAKLGPEVAKAAAAGVLAAAKETANAGTTPVGAAWKPRKADGARALAHAADALSVRVQGNIIVLVLAGVNVYQQKRRQIIPAAGKGYQGIPSAIRKAIEDAARAVLARAA